MSKTIIKEIIIMLLLCLAIILLLGILLYEYVPMKKTVPNEVAYTTPENVKKDLAETQKIDDSDIVMTYEVNSNDLANYKKIQNYRPGKANPFSSFGETSTGGTQSEGNSNNGNANNGTTSNNTTSGTTTNTKSSTGETTTSGGQFFQDKGIK